MLIHPERPSKKKTDRRDARKLADLLWLNRQRLMEGKPVHGLRRIYIATKAEKDDRQLTSMRQGLGRRRTRVVNKAQRILHRHNLRWQYPTAEFQTKSGRKWLEQVPLPEMDRFELNLLLEEWTSIEAQMVSVAAKIVERASLPEQGKILNTTQILMTAPGVGHYTGLGLSSRIGPIDRFPRTRSLANYFGLTPSSRNSGEAKDRLGSITKEGSKFARFLLGQLVLHFLRTDPNMREWYRRIKLRRGAKIARVAVMRRITTIFWHMMKHQEPSAIGGAPPRLRKQQTLEDKIAAA